MDESATGRDPACTERLREARSEAEQQYGDLGLDGLEWPARVCRCLRRRLGEADPTPEQLAAAWQGTARADLVLASACVEGSDRASRAFVKALRERLIAFSRASLAVRNHESFVDELLGHVHLRAPSQPEETILGTYNGAGSLLAWMKILARRRAWDRKAQADRERAGLPLAVHESSHDPLHEREQDESVDAALPAVFDRAPDDQLCLLWCRVARRLPSRLLSQLLGVTESSLSKANGRLNDLVAHLMGRVEVDWTGPRLARIATAIESWGQGYGEPDEASARQLAAVEGAVAALPAEDRDLLDFRVRRGASVQGVGPLFALTANQVHQRVAATVGRLRDAAGLSAAGGLCGGPGAAEPPAAGRPDRHSGKIRRRGRLRG